MKKPVEYLKIERNERGSVIGASFMLRVKSSSSHFQVTGVSKGLQVAAPVSMMNNKLCSLVVSTEGMKPGREEIITMSLSEPWGNKNVENSYVIRVTLDDDTLKPLIHLDEYYVPMVPAHSTRSGYLSVLVGNRRLSTNPHDTNNFADHAILCEYILGRATSEKVIDAAQDAVEEKSAREELPRIKDELLDTQLLLEIEKEGYARLSKECEKEKTKAEELMAVINMIVSAYNNKLGKRGESLRCIWHALSQCDSIRELDKINPRWLASRGVKS